MAHARTIRRQQRQRRGSARVTDVSAAGTELDLGDEGRVVVDGRPDRAHAARVRRSLDRVLWQRLQVQDGQVRGVVAGTRRRRPVQLTVSGGAALGLLETGVPTVARRVGTGS